jgi:twitching motility protein PilT
MQTFNQALAALFNRRLITLDEALGRSSDPEELKNVLASAGAVMPARPAAAPQGR